MIPRGKVVIAATKVIKSSRRTRQKTNESNKWNIIKSMKVAEIQILKGKV